MRIIILLLFLVHLHAGDDEVNAIVEKMFSSTGSSSIEPLMKEIWANDLIIGKGYIAKIVDMWSRAKSVEQKDAVASALKSERMNIWIIDSTAEGVGRKYMIGDERSQQILTEISNYNAERNGVKVRTQSSNLPMDRDSAYNRIIEKFHLNQHVDVLNADLRAVGYLSITSPPYQNLKDIPDYINKSLPNATDLQKLTSVSTIEIPINGKTRVYIVLRKDVFMILDR